MKIELEITDSDFSYLTHTSGKWRERFGRPDDGWAIQLAEGRFENMDREGLPPEARGDWEMAYWLADRRSDVILARAFLKANGYESELLWDMRDDGDYVLLTNYKTQSWLDMEARKAAKEEEEK